MIMCLLQGRIIHRIENNHNIHLYYIDKVMIV